MNEIAQEAAQPGRKKHLVFVYGTLKEGHDNHAHYLKGRADFVEYGRTKERFVMYDTGGFPVVLGHRVKDAPVRGEVYAIDDDILRRLDGLESNGSMYVRNYYDIELVDGSVVPCWMYVGVPSCWDTWAAGQTPINKTNGEFHWR